MNFSQVPLTSELEKIKDKVIWLCGADWGWDAGFVLAFATKYNIVYIYSETISEELFPTTVDNFQRLIKRFPTNLYIIADPGGSAKTLIETMRQTYNIPIIGADKVDKFTAIAGWNHDASLGLIKCYNLLDPSNPQDMIFVKSCNNLVWVDNKSTGLKQEGEPRHENDAALYLWRYWKKNFYRERPDPVPSLTPQELDKKHMRQYIDNLYKPPKKPRGFSRS